MIQKSFFFIKKNNLVKQILVKKSVSKVFQVSFKKIFKVFLYKRKKLFGSLYFEAYNTNPTKQNIPNQANLTKPTKANIPNQTYQTKLTKPKLLVKAVNAWVRSAFGNVYF